jgi:hypothetical protein
MRACTTHLRCLVAPAFLASCLVAGWIGSARPAGAQLPTPGVMNPGDSLYAREFAFIREDGVFHLFWMRRNPFVPYDSTENDFGHAVSVDLAHWTQLDPVLRVRPGHWDDLHVWTPCIVKSGGIYYMFYTGVTNVPYPWNMYQRIGVATSTDLMEWTRYDTPVLSGAQVPWVFADSSVFEGCQFRDAHVMEDPDVPGRWLMYYVGTPDAARDQLIVGVAQSTDLLAWSDLTPLWCTDAAHFWGWCESPHLIRHAGLDYLFVTTTSGHPLGYRVATSPVADSTGWSGKYRLFDMANQDTASDAWYGSETLSIPGHDFLAVVNSTGFRVEIYEIVWGVAPTFSLLSPFGAVGVAPVAPPPAVALAPLGRARPGSVLMLRADVPVACPGRVELYDLAGRRLRTLHDGPLAAGATVVTWDGRVGGAPAPCGIYFAALTTAAGRAVARIPVVW